MCELNKVGFVFYECDFSLIYSVFWYYLKMFLIFKLIFFNDEFDIVMDCRIVNVLLVVIGLILIFLIKRMYKLMFCF